MVPFSFPSLLTPAGARGVRAATFTPPVPWLCRYHPRSSPALACAWVAPNHLFSTRRAAPCPPRDATPSSRPVTRPLARG